MVKVIYIDVFEPRATPKIGLYPLGTKWENQDGGYIIKDQSGKTLAEYRITNVIFMELVEDKDGVPDGANSQKGLHEPLRP